MQKLFYSIIVLCLGIGSLVAQQSPPPLLPFSPPPLLITLDCPGGCADLAVPTEDMQTLAGMGYEDVCYTWLHDNSHDTAQPDICPAETTTYDVVGTSNGDIVYERSFTLEVAGDFELKGTFHNDLIVKNDDTGEPYSGFDFVPGSNTNGNPVAYVSGNSMQISAEITVNCPDPPENIMVRANDANGVYNFPTQTIPVTGTVLTYPISSASTMFPAQKVDMLDLELSWQISTNGGTDWTNLGSNKNRVYVTWKEPLEEKPGGSYENGEGYEYYETIFNLSCKSAIKISQKDEIIENIWSVFEEGEVKRADEELLSYYKSDDASARVASSLIRELDGQCYSWCGLFIATIKIQGIEDQMEIIEFWVNENYSEQFLTGFLVKNWSFNQNPVGSTFIKAAIQEVFPYTHIDILKSANSQNTEYAYVHKEVEENQGIPGQNTTNPISDFSNHALVRINPSGKIYDPSYGRHGAYNSLLEYESKNIAGYIFEFGQPLPLRINEVEYDTDFDGDGTKQENTLVYMFFYKENSVEQETYEKYIYPY